MKSFVEHVYDQYPEKIRLEKYKYWGILKDIKKDFDSQHGGDLKLFKRYMREHFGISIDIDDGNIGPYYKVTDDGKYTLFLLKYC
jgi:hypothetical protein